MSLRQIVAGLGVVFWIFAGIAWHKSRKSHGDSYETGTLNGIMTGFFIAGAICYVIMQTLSDV